MFLVLNKSFKEKVINELESFLKDISKEVERILEHKKEIRENFCKEMYVHSRGSFFYQLFNKPPEKKNTKYYDDRFELLMNYRRKFQHMIHMLKETNTFYRSINFQGLSNHMVLSENDLETIQNYIQTFPRSAYEMLLHNENL